MSVLDRIHSGWLVNLLSDYRQFSSVRSTPLSDSENPAYNGMITWDSRVIVFGICQEIGIQHLLKMTLDQRMSWLAVVSGSVTPYLKTCAHTTGKRSGLSYNLTTESVCYGYFSKKYSQYPVVAGWADGIIAIRWIGKILAIYPNGQVVFKA